MLDTLAIDIFEGEVALVRKCANYKEATILAGAHAGYSVEIFEQTSRNPLKIFEYMNGNE